MKQPGCFAKCGSTMETMATWTLILIAPILTFVNYIDEATLLFVKECEGEVCETDEFCVSTQSITNLKRFQVIITGVSIMITAVVQTYTYWKERQRSKEYSDFTAAGTCTVQLHRLEEEVDENGDPTLDARSGNPKLALAWSPVLHANIDQLLTQKKNMLALQAALAEPVLEVQDTVNVPPKWHIGDLCLVDLPRHVMTDLKDSIAAVLNRDSAAMEHGSYSPCTMVMAVTQEPFFNKPNEPVQCKMRIFLVAEADLEKIAQSKSRVATGRMHSGGAFNPKGIAYAHGTYSPFALLRWRSLERMAKLWLEHTAALDAHYSKPPAAHLTYEGTAKDAFGTPVRKGEGARNANKNKLKTEGKGGGIFFWKPDTGIPNPRLDCFTVLRPRTQYKKVIELHLDASPRASLRPSTLRRCAT